MTSFVVGLDSLNLFYKLSLKGPEDMAQQSRALGVLGDDLGLAHSAAITVRPVPGRPDVLLWPHQALTAQIWYKYIYVGKILIQVCLGYRARLGLLSSPVSLKISYIHSNTVVLFCSLNS